MEYKKNAPHFLSSRKLQGNFQDIENSKEFSICKDREIYKFPCNQEKVVLKPSKNGYTQKDEGLEIEWNFEDCKPRTIKELMKTAKAGQKISIVTRGTRSIYAKMGIGKISLNASFPEYIDGIIIEGRCNSSYYDRDEKEFKSYIRVKNLNFLKSEEIIFLGDMNDREKAFEKYENEVEGLKTLVEKPKKNPTIVSGKSYSGIVVWD